MFRKLPRTDKENVFKGGLNTSVVCRAVTLRAGSVQIYGGGSREGRHGAALEPLAQRSDALGGVGASAVFADATECVVAETAGERRGAACQKCSWGCDAYRPSVDFG